LISDDSGQDLVMPRKPSAAASSTVWQPSATNRLTQSVVLRLPDGMLAQVRADVRWFEEPVSASRAIERSRAGGFASQL